MIERIYKTAAYESYGGTPHLFEVFENKTSGAAPYVIMLDGAFLSTAENGLEISDEIESTVKWFGWKRSNPMLTD